MTDTVCGATEAQCVCALTEHPYSEPHECECGGSWTFSAEGEFEIIAMPGKSGQLSQTFISRLFSSDLGRFFNE